MDECLNRNCSMKKENTVCTSRGKDSSSPSNDPFLLGSPCSSATPPSTSNPPCDTEVGDILNSMEKKLSGLEAGLTVIEVLRGEFKALRQSLEQSQARTETLTEENTTLQDSVSTLSAQLTSVTAENKRMKETIRDLRARSINDSVLSSAIPEETTGRTANNTEPVRPLKCSETQSGSSKPDLHDGVHELLVIKEEDSLEWSPSLDQKDPLHIKEEQEGQQLNELVETHITNFPFTTVTVKSEDDEEKPFSQFHQRQPEDNGEAEPQASSSTTQIKTETDGEDCGGSETIRIQDPDDLPQLDTDEKTSDCSETELSYDWQEPLSETEPKTESDREGTRAAESRVNALKYKNVCDVGGNAEKKTLSCFDCGKGFHDKGPLQRHMMCHLGKRSSSCLVKKKCRAEKKVVLQMRLNTGEKTFDCRECGITFSFKRSLESHMLVHAVDKPFGCDVCGKRFTKQGSLKAHTRLHTGEKPFVCEVCMHSFTDKKYLEAHMKIHTGEKPFSCDVCGKTFSQKRNLKSHMRVHTGERPFGCGVCGRKFTEQGILKTHMRVHTGEKPFGCDECGKRFIQQGILKRHMIVHAGEKPFGCDVCGKRFTQQGNVKTHMRVHTGEKPFGCGFCGKKYAEQRSLNTHMKVHSG
ncbi:oocyte zinc finger protein XlCOF6-like [Acanthopagrus latus]|uniref:oocyte zinc finger protein XlCOF6-like n=1 Tax=Acanthopagrus latus TaxID=8177 RepID=UPI00187C8755|nr:oocyte zinc finger protein XlCOF6-like [Acanthopagrus latus]